MSAHAVPRVVRNDWSSVSVPELGAWTPTMTVTVVVPAYNNQEKLDVVLAALTRQTYPAHLLDVVVVDDGSQPPLHLPGIRPERTRLLWGPDYSTSWGCSNAGDIAARAAEGDIIQRLDSDMLVYPEHVEAQARWHHVLPYAVTLGTKRMIDTAPGSVSWPTPEKVASIRSIHDLFDYAASEPHDYIEKILRGTDDLRAGDHLNFMAHVGATWAMRRDLYHLSGGTDNLLRLGEDNEFAYRLHQVGAVFIPEWEARSWHLGLTHMMQQAAQLRRYNRPFLAEQMPYPRWLRKVGGSAWKVPLVTAVVEVDGQPLELVRACVDALLRGSEQDLRVRLVGRWDELTEERQSVLRDPLLELRLIGATYRSDPRVSLVTDVPESVFPSAHLLEVPVTAGFSRSALGRLVDEADQHQVGLVEVAGPAPVRLWRTAALGRIAWFDVGAPRAQAVTEVYGARTLTAAEAGVSDLSAVPLELLDEGVAGLKQSDPGKWLPATVQVGGLRSLAQATALVGRLSAARAKAKIRRLSVRRK
ncbi:glycosyltransferase [Catellatospora sp. KI3]|uniref:glycosyltransferase family 2 protein n=1 Tax=Catellatospora sp. KI3 TaxID=3041620 RepID=UPI002482B441|nr:glycosyltransferase [Catellatospora sp. KI3]MDI1466297.1 glycosyltransferase [Catellatospora sp. KI3]